MSGFNGDDTLIGEAGNDFMGGGQGNDSLDGGDGADQINAGFGNDTMTGSFGLDMFIFNAPERDAVDIITDFEDGIDLLRLRGVTNASVVEPQDKFDALNIGDGIEGAQIEYRGQTIVLEGIFASDLDVSDFVFI